MKKKHTKFILVKSQQKIQRVNVDDIYYLKSDNNYTEIHVRTGEIVTVSKNLLKCSGLIETDYFYKIGSRYFANLLNMQKWKLLLLIKRYQI